MKKITKIVLTGGPCGGKTTGISRIEKEMSGRGYKVVVVGESATTAIMSGITFPSFNDGLNYQKQITKMQILKEKYYEECCKNLKEDKILLVCDRGVMDGKAFVSEEEFKEIIDELGEDMLELRDNYDGVFHLVSCAIGAEDSYNTLNNIARSENAAQARAVDERVLSAWTGHPHLRVIDNSTDFEGKIKRLVKEICALLGEPMPFEIERKFLIEMPDIEYLKNLPHCQKVSIIQTYLTPTNDEERRVRQRGGNGSYIYTLTTKHRVSNIKRIEVEEKISQKQYLTYLESADTSLKQIRKERYCLIDNGKYFEIDIYPFAKERAIVEIELSEENEKIVLPPFIKLLKEVTDDESFTNYEIAKNIPSELY